MKRAALPVISLALAFAAAPHRIVCLSPSLTEILYGIGAFPEVVGVSDYATYPPEAAKLPSVGGWATPDLEKLVALRPGLVVLDDAQAPLFQDKLRALGFHLLVVPSHNIAEVYAAMETLGRATGHEGGAARLANETREGLARVAKRTAPLPRVSVVLIVDRTPGTLQNLYTVTKGGYLAELIEIAGGRIAAAPASIGYSRLSKEDLLAIDPDVILDFNHGPTGTFSGNPLDAWREMPELKAVRTHRVYSVTEEYVPHASQRMVLTAELFARLLHPEAK
ncbi:MAG TPA: helical backbone metal receptor [Bryobacteraceae bacterium]|jgi:iron complex transport system substrate-binding protein|nr:helical backbone metal receptor [Bryobacteraceae bacterium]